MPPIRPRGRSVAEAIDHVGLWMAGDVDFRGHTEPARSTDAAEPCRDQPNNLNRSATH